MSSKLPSISGTLRTVAAPVAPRLTYNSAVSACEEGEQSSDISMILDVKII